MRHIEMHLIETVRDLDLAEVAGLDVLETETCEECMELVGEVDNQKFVPYVVLLDDESEWIVCAECAQAVL